MLKDLKDYWAALRSGLFDHEYYLEMHPEVNSLKVDPLWHYLNLGWTQEWNPSKSFDAKFYLRSYADVKSARINPLLHYIYHGKKEGRLITPPHDKDVEKINPIAKVGIAIVNYNSTDYLVNTLASLATAKTNIKYLVGVIDNGSSSSEAEKCKRLVNSFIIQREDFDFFISSPNNMGFSGANNLVIRRLFSDPSITHICLLNPDVIVSDYWLDHLIGCGVDVCGPVTNAAGNEQTIEIDYALGNLQNYNANFSIVNEFSMRRHELYKDSVNETDILYFFCTLFTRKVVEETGFLDEQFFPGSYEDNDYCLRLAKNNFHLYVNRGCFVHHFGSGSFSKLEMPKRIDISNINKKRFETKWNVRTSNENWKLLHSSKLDIEFLLKQQFDENEVNLLSNSLASVERLISNQTHQIEALSTVNLVNTEGLSNQRNSTNISGVFDPNETNLDMVSGRVLLRKVISKASHKLLRFSKLSPFSFKRPLAYPNPLKTYEQIIRSNTLRKKAICFFAPTFNSKNERDGYFQRIRAIDNHVFNDYFRIYIHDDKTFPSHVKISNIDKNRILVIYNSSSYEQRIQVRALVEQIGVLYIHSILRIMPGYINPEMLNVIEKKKVRVIWDVHGSVPEEFLLNNDPVNSDLANTTEEFIYHKADVIVVVSEAMKDHLIRKYGETSTEFIYLPLINEGLNNLGDFSTSKENTAKTLPIIIYAGGVQHWQNIELLKQIVEKTEGNYNYKILVPNPDSFSREWKPNRPVTNVSIYSKPQNKLGDEYRKSHYGLILRDDITVNNVAVPTKLLEYLYYDIVPIVKSPAIGDFETLGMKYISYQDLLNNRLPSENVRTEMAKCNKKVLAGIIDYARTGESRLLDAVKEFSTQKSEDQKKNSKSIGLVIRTFDKGGLEQTVFNLYEGYREKGFDAYILCEESDEGYLASKLKNKEHLFAFNGDPKRFLSFCFEKKIGWLHYHYNTFLMDKVHEYGIRSIYSIQNIYSWMSDKEIKDRARFINTADFIVAGSSFTKDYYCYRTNTKANRVDVISIGVDTKDLENTDLDTSLTRQYLGIKNDDIVLANIASFHKVKHQMNLLGAMEQVIKSNNHVKLIFVGNIGHTDYYNYVKDSWESSPAKQNILFIPYIDHSQIGEFLRRTIDIFVLPSIQEGCSNAVIDALFCGKPMLLTNVGNAGDLKDLPSVTVIDRPYNNLYQFRENDISEISLQKKCRNTNELTASILSMAKNIESLRISAMHASEKYKEICDKKYMVQKYLDLISSKSENF